MSEFMAAYFTEVDIQTHRNIADYPFTASIGRADRSELSKIVKDLIIKYEPSVFDNKGRFNALAYSHEFLNDFPLLKSAGVYRDWPDDRVIYINDSEGLILLINEEDHIKIKLNLKESGKIAESLMHYYELLEILEKELIIAYDKEFGYLAALPSNVGSGTYFRIKIKLNGKNENQDEIIKILEKSKNDIEYYIFENQLVITNKTPFYNFANCLVELINLKDHLK
jgi:protein-arginine kinase